MKKYDYKILSLGLAIVGLVILGIIGLTYAFFVIDIEGNNNATETVIETADLRLVFNDTQIISLDNALPGSSISKTFTVQNIGVVAVTYGVTIEDVINTFVNDELVYTITSNNGGGSVTNEVMPAEAERLLISSIEPGITQTYTITILFKETGQSQNINMGAEFSGRLQIEPDIKYVTIGGYIYDANQKVLSNVTVEIHSDPKTTTTNAYGYYEIENIQTGKHTIYVKNGGTILATKVINLKQDEEASIVDKTLKVPSEYKNVNIEVNAGLNINLSSPSGLITMIKNFGGSGKDYYMDTVSTIDGGYVAVGYSYSTNIGLTNKGDRDAIIVKYNSIGAEQWKKSIGGSSYEEFHGVNQTLDGGVIVVGHTNSTNAGFTNKGSDDAIIVKYNSSGTEEWKKNFGGNDVDSFQDVVQTTDGGYVAVGYSKSTNISGLTNYGNYDAIIVKYNSTGTELWKKSFGGNSLDRFYRVIEIGDEGYIVVGNSTSTNISGLTNNGGYDAIIVKYNLSGEEVWKQNFGGNSTDYFEGVTQAADGGVVAVGHTTSTDISGLIRKGYEDGIIVKYDSSGVEVWKQNFGGNNSDWFYELTQTTDDGYLVVGASKSTNISTITNKGAADGIVVKYNSSGEEEWKKNFGGSGGDLLYGVTKIINGEYIIVGYTTSTDISGLTSKGSDDAIIISFAKSS